jgi:pyruvate kinase
MLVKMLDAGMDVARLDMQAQDHKTHEQCVANLKEALKLRPDKVCGIVIDTKGPEIRTGMLKENKPVDILANQELLIVTDYSIEGDVKRLSCNYKSLPQTVHVGQEIFIDDGNLTCEVVEIMEASIKVICKNAHKMGERKDIILPGAILDLPSLTETDEDDIVEFGLK